MFTNKWLPVCGVAGATAVMFGAAGAHLIKDLEDEKKNAKFKKVFDTGVQYHLAHSIALTSAALGLKCGRKKNLVCGAFSVGIILFSGSCYAVGISKERLPYSRPAPFGGFALITAWLLLGFFP